MKATFSEAGRRPLRVCHLAYTFYETDNRVTRYARILAGRGDDVDVVALRRPGQRRTDVDHGVRLFRIQRRTKTEGAPWTYLLKILWFLVKATCLLSVRQLHRRYDVVHVHNVPDFLVFAAVVPRLLGAKVILDIHDILPELYAGKFKVTQQSGIFHALLLIERLSCRFSNHVVVANDIWRERLVQRAVPAARCTTILNYPDLRIFRPRPAGSVRDANRFLILYPGTLSRHQGLDVAIRAFARVKELMLGAEFHIYGEGPARGELERLVDECTLRDHISIKDPLPVEDIARVIAQADVGVEPKGAVGFGNEALSTKILEFMACEVPVIASRTQVHARYFDDSVVRFFVPGDEEDLARALVEVHARRGNDEAIIQKARQHADHYSWQRRSIDYEQLVSALAGHSPSTVAIGQL